MTREDDPNKPMATQSEIAWQKRQAAIREAKERCERKYREADRMLDLEIQSANAAYQAACDKSFKSIDERWLSEREAA